MENMTLNNGDFILFKECRDLHHFNTSDACAFVNATEDCAINEGLINYTFLTYCSLRSSLLPLSICILAMWLCFLFIALAVAADDFFCPALVVISKSLHLSDNLAGVTLLAFGNGAPDVFSAIAAVRSDKDGTINLAFGALLGSGTFLTTIVAGSVCIIHPFKMMERPFLRDVIFYMASVYMTYYILNDGVIHTMEAVGYIIIYVMYVILVLVARFIYKKMKSQNLSIQESNLAQEIPSPSDNDDDRLDDPVYTVCSHHINTHHHAHPDGIQIQVSAQSSQCSTSNDDESLLTDGAGINGDGDDNDDIMLVLSSPVQEFMFSISPVCVEDWKDSSMLMKIIAIIKGVAKFVMRLTVPVVDLENQKNNWNRHLNTFHCIISPIIALYLANPKWFLLRIHDVFPVWAVVLLAGTALSILVYFTSHNSHPPVYHWVFAYVGFLVAVLWIQCIATEVVNLLQTFGIIFNMSYTILGLTFLAWGNSIGDFIADVAMARQGYPRMAISACYGGPMFNLLLGVGIPFTIVCAQNGGQLDITLGLVELVLIASLLVILPVTLVVVPFVLKFQMTRVFGFFLFAMYGVFVLLVILVECKVIHWKT